MPAFQVNQRQSVEVFLDQSKLDEVMKRRVPTRYFWCDMSDIFGEWVPREMIQACFDVMEATPQHTHLVLTKRPERIEPVLYGAEGNWYLGGGDWLPNVWIGFSAEDQATFDQRWAVFQRRDGERCSWAYAMHLFVSLEPLLGPICLPPMTDPTLGWVIVGGESGPGARPFDLVWARSLIWQCQDAGIACFVKQVGRAPYDSRHRWISRGGRVVVPVDSEWTSRDPLHDIKGGDPAEWPEDLRVRQFPTVTP